MRKNVKRVMLVASIFIVVGVIIAIIGSLNGGLNVSNQIVSDTISFKTFKNIEIDVDAFEVELIAGEAYKVEYAYLASSKKPEISVEKDTLIVHSKNNRKSLNFSLFDGFQLFNQREDQKIKVYYPKDIKLGNLKISQDLGDCQIDSGDFETMEILLDMGDLKIASVSTGILDVQVDLGDCTLVSVNAKESNFNMDMGDLTGEKLITQGMEAVLSYGDVELEGNFQGTSNITNDMGDVTITTHVSKESYNYDIHVDMGNASVDRKSVKNQTTVNNNASNHMNVENSMGDVDLNFVN